MQCGLTVDHDLGCSRSPRGGRHRDARGRRLKAIGRPKVSVATETAIKERLAAGIGMLKVAHELRVGSGTVQRVKREMAAVPCPVLATKAAPKD